MCVYLNKKKKMEKNGCKLLAPITYRERDPNKRQQENTFLFLYIAYQMSGSGVYNGLLG